MTFEEFIDEFVTVFDETSKEELKPETNFRDQKKTLTDNEVQPLIDKMVEKLDKSLQIKLR